MSKRGIINGAIILCGFMALGCLTACDGLGAALGMERSSPDDGTVVTNQPLSIPPDFEMKPPRETPKDKDPASDESASDPSLTHH